MNGPMHPSVADARPIERSPGWLARWTGLVDRNHGTWRGWVRTLLGQIELVSGRLDPWVGPAHFVPRRLVFVCLGNINRSAFAGEVARRLGVPCSSIGLATSTGQPAYEMAVHQAAAMGYDLTAHRATDFTDYVWQEGDLLLAMEVRHVHRLIGLGVPRESISLLGHWAAPARIHLHDPHTLSAAYFATCFTLIESAVRQLCHSLDRQAMTEGRPR